MLKQEEAEELAQAVSSGQSLLDWAEEKLARSKRRYEKRIKALEYEVDDLRDVSSIF